MNGQQKAVQYVLDNLAVLIVIQLLLIPDDNLVPARTKFPTAMAFRV